MAQVALVPNDRVLLRDRPWRVQKVLAVANDCSLIELEALDGDQPASLFVAVPPEEPVPLPSEELEFDLRQLDSFTAWSRAHRILAATLVHETERNDSQPCCGQSLGFRYRR